MSDTNLEPVLQARNTTAPVPLPTKAERIELGRSETQVDMDLAHEIVGSDMLPAAYKNKAAKIAEANLIVVFGLGRALGIERIAAMYGFHVIDGTPSPSAKMQAALSRRAGHKLRTIARTNTEAICQIVRHDDPDYPVTVEYNEADARAAGDLDVWVIKWEQTSSGKKFPNRWDFPEGLGISATNAELQAAGAPDWVLEVPLGDRKRKDNYFRKTRTMLWHRAVTEAVGAACPEVLSGLDFDYQAEPMVSFVDDSAPDPVDVLKPQPVESDPDDGIEDADIVDDEADLRSSDGQADDQPEPEKPEQLEPEAPEATVDEAVLREQIKKSPHSMAAVMRHFEAKAFDDLLTDQTTIDAVTDFLEGPA